MHSVLAQLEQALPDLTPGQRKLARYVADNLEHTVLLHSSQLAERAGVSKATVSRFVRRLGFANFLAFKNKLGQLALKENRTTRRFADSLTKLEEREHILTKVIASDTENMQRILADNSLHTFQQAVNKLCSARSIYVLGLRSSYALSFFLSFNLHFFLSNVLRITPGAGDIPEQILNIGQEDVLVAIGFKRYTRETFEITKAIKQKKAAVIGITDSRLSPVATIADLNLFVDTKLASFFESYTAVMSLLNGLIAGIALNKENEAMQAMQDLETAFDQFQTFIV